MYWLDKYIFDLRFVDRHQYILDFINILVAIVLNSKGR